MPLVHEYGSDEDGDVSVTSNLLGLGVSTLHIDRKVSQSVVAGFDTSAPDILAEASKRLSKPTSWIYFVFRIQIRPLTSLGLQMPK